MKKILFAIAILFSFSASAQVDSSQFMLPFQVKQKFAKVMVPATPALEDARFIDSLNKAIGSGDTTVASGKADSVSTVSFKIGTYLKGAETIANMQVGAAYDFGVEFFAAPLTGNGYSGLIAALNYYAASGTANQKIAAIWGKRQLADLLTKKAASLTEAINNGYLRAKAVKTIIYN